MTTQTKVIQSTSALNWKSIWRGNALINALFGDVLIFATPQVIDLMGMSSEATTPLRLLGAVSILYAIWQFWVSRQLSKTSFYIGDGVETLVGLICFGALALGLDLNATGSALLMGLGVMGWLTAGLWFFASRQVS